ncbi:hypothetical protein D9758_002293 [Tetrapyrgos nigripes]|uniref:RNA-dependent RNA polymerase n=1 Tax=Tetrapyrgos nigripes TaxID=182062 RepID=A0A8H5GPM5_9AGAR|nr:hypothetical protein D9758_002293 [Tetrapyrgos nigripes]
MVSYSSSAEEPGLWSQLPDLDDSFRGLPSQVLRDDHQPRSAIPPLSLSQKADEEVTRTPTNPASGATPLHSGLDRIRLQHAKEATPDATRSHNFVNISDYDKDDTPSSSDSSQGFSDLDLIRSRQTSMTSVESNSPPRKRRPEPDTILDVGSFKHPRIASSSKVISGPSNIQAAPRTNKKGKAPLPPRPVHRKQDSRISLHSHKGLMATDGAYDQCHSKTSKSATVSSDVRPAQGSSVRSSSGQGSCVTSSSTKPSKTMASTSLNSNSSTNISVPPDAKASTSTSDSMNVEKSKQSSTSVPSGSFSQELWNNISELPVFIIAHYPELQTLYDDPNNPVPWPVQYEIARGLLAQDWCLEEILDKIRHLQGETSADILHKLKMIIKGLKFVEGSGDNRIGKELDREQLAIIENRGRGLGLMGPWEDAKDWHGGQVQQNGVVIKQGDSFKINLEPLEMRRSTRLGRFLGSRRIIQLRVSSDYTMNDRDAVEDFLSQKFVLNGRVFLPIPPKDNTVYLVEVNENHERESRDEFGDQYRMTLGEVLDWHNPMEMNDGQVVSKFWARTPLMLSTTKPVVEFAEDDIVFIPDDVVPGSGPKPPAHKIVTDGCGFINEVALKIIYEKMGYATLPTAAQARIAGSKGLYHLIVDGEKRPRIYIRDSQRKIKYANLHRSHRILDLVAVSNSVVSFRVSLSQQSAVNIWHNGVPATVIQNFMEQGLRDGIEPLLQWDNPVVLWDALNRAGRVVASRLARLAPGQSRALGLTGREKSDSAGTADVDNSDVSDEEERELKELGFLIISSTYTGRNEHSGAPAALHEVGLELVQAGFIPSELKYLLDKLRRIIKNALTADIEKCHIPLPEGTAVEAFVIPDPTGKLQEGQIYFRSASGWKDPRTQTLTHVVIGEVVVGRYPIRLPSDIQKVEAVDIPELSIYVDVIIVPKKPSNNTPRRYGGVSFMHMLSGGDMDGDTVFMTWCPEIVKPFRKKSLTVPPPGLEDDFEAEIETIPDFRNRLASMPLRNRQRAFQKSFLSGLTRVNVGMYSLFHDIAAWRWGLDSQKTTRLAYIFNALLDSGKTGQRLKQSVYKTDLDQSNTDRPPCPWKPSGKRLKAHPDYPNKKFILDILAVAGKKIADRHLIKFDQDNGLAVGFLYNLKTKPDTILLEPLNQAKKRIESFSVADETDPEWEKSRESSKRILEAELVRIQMHVDKAYELFVKCTKKNTASSSDGQAPPKRSKEDHMRAVPAQYSRPIACIRLTENLEEVKASYAYSKSERFGFCVAFQVLCDLKAQSVLGGRAPTTRTLDEARSVSSAARRALG